MPLRPVGEPESKFDEELFLEDDKEFDTFLSTGLRRFKLDNDDDSNLCSFEVFDSFFFSSNSIRSLSIKASFSAFYKSIKR